jgi:hypothetical protein
MAWSRADGGGDGAAKWRHTFGGLRHYPGEMGKIHHFYISSKRNMNKYLLLWGEKQTRDPQEWGLNLPRRTRAARLSYRKRWTILKGPLNF